MKRFYCLDKNFREEFLREKKKGWVRFSVKGIKDNPDSIYPIFTVSHKHVSYYSVFRQEDVVITDRFIEAIIYEKETEK